MERTEIFTKIELIFREVFDDNTIQIAEEMSAADIEEWNSLNHMILVSEVEKVFSIKFKLKDLNKMRNIGDMMDIVTSKLSEQK